MVELYKQLREAIKCTDEALKYKTLLEVGMQAIIMMHYLDGDECAGAIEVYFYVQDELGRMKKCV